MDVFEKYKQEYKLIVGSLASIITAFILSITDKYFISPTVTKIVVVIFVILLVYFGNAFLDNRIENSVWLRRLLLGKNFIEGYYYDFTIDKETNSVKHGVLFCIDYFKGLYKANGVTYSSDGKKIATWKSNSCCFSQDTLYIHYISFTDYSNFFIENGLMQLQFEQPPTSYTGFYIDFTNSFRFLITGKKVTKEQLKEYKNFSNEDNRRNFIVEFLKQNHL
jgi:hypothetical protein